MALALTDRVHAEALELLIEYDPQPPFESGSPTPADASTLLLAFRMLLGDLPMEMASRVYGHMATAPAGRWESAASRTGHPRQ